MNNLEQRQSKRFNKTPDPISAEMHKRKQNKKQLDIFFSQDLVL